MNDWQKAVAVCGLMVLIATTFIAPYDYTAHDELARLTGGGKQLVSGVVHAPFWRPPSLEAGLSAPEWLRDVRPEPSIQADSVSLAAGRMLLWWVAIIAVTTVVVLVLGTTTNSERHLPPPRPTKGGWQH